MGSLTARIGSAVAIQRRTESSQLRLEGRIRATVETGPSPAAAKTTMKTFMCLICGLIYHEADGWPEDGIAPGTLWVNVPGDWYCPECGVGKADFEMVEL